MYRNYDSPGTSQQITFCIVLEISSAHRISYCSKLPVVLPPHPSNLTLASPLLSRLAAEILTCNVHSLLVRCQLSAQSHEAEANRLG